MAPNSGGRPRGSRGPMARDELERAAGSGGAQQPVNGLEVRLRTAAALHAPPRHSCGGSVCPADRRFAAETPPAGASGAAECPAGTATPPTPGRAPHGSASPRPPRRPPAAAMHAEAAMPRRSRPAPAAGARPALLALALAALAALLALAGPAAAQLPVNCPVTAGQYDPNADYFPNKVAPRIAQYLSVSYQKSYKILRNSLRNETYVLYMCNTPRPPRDTIPGVAANARLKYFEIPLSDVGCSSRTAVTYLERLGLRPAIRYVSSTSIMTSPCLLKMAADGNLQSYPAQGNVSGIDANFARGPGPAQTNASVEDISITLSAVWEDTPLQKFEWLLFISAFFNLESQATQTFRDVSEGYSCNAANVLKLADRKPVVAWLTALEDGTFVTVDWTYRTQLLLDAGVTALISPSVAPLADVQTSIMDADVVIDDTTGIQSFDDFLTVYGLKGNNTGISSPFKFLATRRVYKTDRRRNGFGIDDFAQSSWAQPDVVQNGEDPIFHSPSLSHPILPDRPDQRPLAAVPPRLEPRLHAQPRLWRAVLPRHGRAVPQQRHRLGHADPHRRVHPHHRVREQQRRVGEHGRLVGARRRDRGGGGRRRGADRRGWGGRVLLPQEEGGAAGSGGGGAAERGHEGVRADGGRGGGDPRRGREGAREKGDEVAGRDEGELEFQGICIGRYFDLLLSLCLTRGGPHGHPSADILGTGCRDHPLRPVSAMDEL
ncbi:hypothetical protein DFJ74DRAFT_438770 [Hyaloraphidium curvatum]|nr:hypothetical protein DFJ74DRAFT_438770 [Hyaloraphidium curvatum]